MRRREGKTVMGPEDFEPEPLWGELPGALDRRAVDDLFSATYEELRRLASTVRRDDPSGTLSPTALVHEAWLKLAGSPRFTATSRLHFKQIAARAMRQLLVEAARRRKRINGGPATPSWSPLMSRSINRWPLRMRLSPSIPLSTNWHA